MTHAELTPWNLGYVHWTNLALREPTQRGGRILQRLLIEIERLAVARDGGMTCIGPTELREIAERGIPYRPRDWFGSATVAERKAWSRAAQRLEADGHVCRTLERHRQRVTHLVPTPAGFAWALAAAPKVNAQRLRDALHRMHWGQPLLEHGWPEPGEETHATDSGPPVHGSV
ncbi:hypothetical protein Mal4_40370 [Maioricimonas rarisocia]|uniref:Uncharacterized protein n=1 Tax=Maioricimonas rarisocia TaxID=2528026 RepID=A0A517ZB86_9PLAN|nr:hypothetical protein [Maioricimonas rarisocia]QDU39691.1 hypothetical protein Mal4_40370 [Maioricimonas rarisocia]